MNGTVWFSEFPNGGFANTVFQYIFSVYLKESLDVEVLYGRPGHNEDALCWEMFDIPKLDPERYERELKKYVEPETKFFGATFKKKRKVLKLSENRRLPPSNDLTLIERQLVKSPSHVVLADGYFQYDTQLLARDSFYLDIFNQNCDPGRGLSPFSRAVREWEKRLMTELDNRACYAIHIRRGDYLTHNNDVCYQLDMQKCIKKIHAWFRAELSSVPILFVASDDLEYCENFFQNANIPLLTSKNFMRTDSSANDRLLCDISALVCANGLIISNSSFSMLAALMNSKAKDFFRQTKSGDIFRFDPWQSQVLLGL